MRYADNEPCKECSQCLDRERARRCSGCEARTLQIFIRWAFVAFIVVAAVFYAKADEIAVTSNVSTVKGWIRENLTFDTDTGTFSRTNFPSFAQAAALEQVATNLPSVLADATTSMSNNLAPLTARLDEQRGRPIATIIAVAGPNAALDRQNLTFYSVSNEVIRTDGGFDIRHWVYGNSILSSNPIMDFELSTRDGSQYGGEYKWKSYGTNEVEITINGETYECYEMTAHIDTAATNLNVYVNPWIQIAHTGEMFNFGNRQRKINNVLCCTTNDLSWCGRFATTNGTAISYVPYADRGYLFWTAPEKEEEE